MFGVCAGIVVLPPCVAADVHLLVLLLELQGGADQLMLAPAAAAAARHQELLHDLPLLLLAVEVHGRRVPPHLQES